jgi:hypothetical protein
MTTLFETDGRAACYAQDANVYDLTGRPLFYFSEGMVHRCGDACAVGWVADGWLYKNDGSSPLYFGID